MILIIVLFMVDFDHKTILLGTMIPISLYSFFKLFNLWR